MGILPWKSLQMFACWSALNFNYFEKCTATFTKRQIWQRRHLWSVVLFSWIWRIAYSLTSNSKWQYCKWPRVQKYIWLICSTNTVTDDDTMSCFSICSVNSEKMSRIIFFEEYFLVFNVFTFFLNQTR